MCHRITWQQQQQQWQMAQATCRLGVSSLTMLRINTVKKYSLAL